MNATNTKRPGRKKGPYAQTKRTIAMMYYLVDNPSTLHQLAARFDIDERTVRRDLEALHDGGCIISHSTHAHGEIRYRVVRLGVV